MKLTVWPRPDAGPGLIAVAQPATVCRPVFSFGAWLAPLVNDGASLTGVTVIGTVLVSTPPLPSLMLEVNETAPLQLASGV